MPQVPYQPFATERPSGQGLPSVHVNTPGAAFGENIGQATQGLGKVLEGAGNEIFQRALALQQLNNETEAKEADAQYMIKVGELHANYSSLQGKTAVEAYPKYAQDIQDLRQSMRGDLSNDMARKMFDGISLSTMGRTIFNGAGHAATQNKVYVAGASSARVEAIKDYTLKNPGDEQAFQQNLEVVASEVRHTQAIPAGWSPEKTDEQVQHATSSVISSRLVGMARTEPFKAADMLDKFRSQMTEQDFLRVDGIVRSNSRAVGAANIANSVFADGQGTEVTPGKSLKEMEEQVKAKATAVAPDDPILAQHAVTNLRTQYNQDRYAKKQEDATNMETVQQAILGGAKDERQLRLDPKIAAAIDALPKDKQLAIPGMINRYNASRDKTDNEDTFTKLMGLSNNDVEQFLNVDPTSQNLSQQQMRAVMSRQAKLKEHAGSDPRVNRAISQIRTSMGSQLEALGIFRRTEANKEDYDHFTGTVQSALDEFQAANKRPPSYKEMVDEIGPQVLKLRKEPGMLWGTNETPFFKQTVPEKFSSEFKAAAEGQGLVATDEMVYKAYIRGQFKQLYGKPKDAAQAPQSK